MLHHASRDAALTKHDAVWDAHRSGSQNPRDHQRECLSTWASLHMAIEKGGTGDMGMPPASPYEGKKHHLQPKSSPYYSI